MSARTTGSPIIQVGRYMPTPILLNLGLVSANVQLSPTSYYRLWASVNCFFDTGPTNAVAATTNSHPLTAGLDTLHRTDEVNLWLAGIVAAGSGVLFISQIDPQS